MVWTMRVNCVVNGRGGVGWKICSLGRLVVVPLPSNVPLRREVSSAIYVQCGEKYSNVKIDLKRVEHFSYVCTLTKKSFWFCRIDSHKKSADSCSSPGP